MFDFQDKKNRYKMTAAALFTAAAMCVGGCGDAAAVTRQRRPAAQDFELDFTATMVSNGLLEEKDYEKNKAKRAAGIKGNSCRSFFDVDSMI